MGSIRIGPQGQTREELDLAESEWVKRGLHPDLLRSLLKVDVAAKRRRSQIEGLIKTALDLPVRSSSRLVSFLDSDICPSDVDCDLQLKFVELVNFLQFRQVRIDLQSNAFKPVVIIEGKNGFGKSSFLRAVRFALLGIDEAQDMVYFINNATPGNQAEAKVVLGFNSHAWGDVEIRRFRTYNRGTGGWSRSTRPDSVVVLLGKEPLDRDRSLEWLKDQFPADLLAYFVFDAESSVVQELSGQKGEGLPLVQDAVEKALAIKPIRELAAVCCVLAKEANDDARKRRAKVDAANDERRRLLSDVERLLRDLSDAKRDEATAQRALAQAQKDVERYSGKGNVERQRHRERLKEMLRLAQEREARSDQDRKAIVTNALPLALLGLSIRPSRSTAIDGWSSDKRQGAEFSIEAIARAIGSGRVPWAPPPLPAQVEMVRVLREVVGLPSADDQGKARRREETIASIRQPAEAARARLRGLLHSEGGALWEERLPTIQQELEALGGAEDAEWVDARVAAETAKAKCELTLKGAEGRAGELQQLLDAGREAVAAEDAGLPDKGGIERLEKQSSLADTAAQAFSAIADQMLDRRISVLETEATHMLVRTAHKHDVLTSLKIDRKTYRYAIYDKNGNAAPAGRSTGERTLLALCLVHAIREAAGARLPMIVEGLLRVLDPEHKDKVLDEMVANCTGQMILLVTPNEIPAELSQHVRDRVAQRLVMRHGRGGEQTDVLEYPETPHA